MKLFRWVSHGIESPAQGLEGSLPYRPCSLPDSAPEANSHNHWKADRTKAAALVSLLIESLISSSEATKPLMLICRPFSC